MKFYTLGVLLFLTHLLFAQNTEQKIKEPLTASGNIQITNNGVSLFPNFSLGKPALIVNTVIKKKNLSFEPEFRWSLNAKPWSYIFWLRHRYSSEKFSFRTGIHPAYVFGEKNVVVNNSEVSRFIVTRYAAGEFSPAWQLSEKVNIGLHYLHARALDSYGSKVSNFISLQPKFTNLNVSEKYFFNFFPQLFYLMIEDKKGTYMSESLTLNRRNYPVYLSSMATYKIKSTIAGDNFVWSIGLNYKF